MSSMKLGIQSRHLANLGEVFQPKEQPPLISCQRYLNEAVVKRKADTFHVFVVRIHECTLRGKQYRVIVDGHHNYAAAKRLGVEPTFSGPGNKFLRILGKMTPRQQEAFMINNVTDCDHYYVETGEIVAELEAPMVVK
ncbi:chromosome partitioning protein ParB [Halomonas aquamarina]|uniref:Chromosome partitioning protein ParB n=1 Tax=Vreelandella aquamarina TaxID=77097 RepID=A0ACC5VZ52_9GAMM|nr:chromosome partitioning protein ParB [Halomonas aquamarina]MBZ5489179.1 chromosome partitioning protein ParB [Halomonas aquamarina]